MDSAPTFVKRFGDLVMLLRMDPGNDAAQDLALSAAAAAVAERPVQVEAGVEWNSIPDDMVLKARMLARQVDCIRVAAGAEPHELQALARALAHDLTPVRPSPHIQVDFVRLLAPPPPEGGGEDPGKGSRPGGAGVPANRRHASDRRHGGERRRTAPKRWSDLRRPRGPDRRVTGERRLVLIAELRSEIAKRLDALRRGTAAGASREVLDEGHRLVRLMFRVPRRERRMLAIQVRRAVSRSALGALLELAERDHVVRDRAAELLGWFGLETVEVILDRLREGEAPGFRLFCYEVVAGVPAAYRLVTPMLRSASRHELRHGAALLGRLGRPEAVEPLERLLDHPDALVRNAAVRALGELHEGPAAEPLCRALHHSAAPTRAVAAEAIALWRGGVLALLLAAALERESHRDAWRAMVAALGRIGSAEACAALATIAGSRRSLFGRRGYTTAQRLAAIAALGLAGTGHAQAALERLSREREAAVSSAAGRVLRAEAARAG